MNKAIQFPDEYRLQRPKNQYFESAEDPEAVAYCAALNALRDQAINGTLYVKFVDGDRKGSIAKMQIDPVYHERRAEIVERYYRWDQKARFEIQNEWIYGIAKWDKRKNSCQIQLPHPDLICLPNYQGPTIYEMFDRKAAKEELLKNPDQQDIDGKILAVGDKVLYINARYGSGFVLCHGTIKEFKVVADSKGHSFTTIVRNDDGDEESSISYPFQMIWKKP